MAKNVSTAELTRLIELVDAKLAEAAIAAGDRPSKVAGWSDWHRRHNSALEGVKNSLATDEGARFNGINSDNCRVRIAGITSTSTGGIAGALRNWIAAAIRKRMAIGRAAS